jgi:sugar phosphate isomerase/epimerase
MPCASRRFWDRKMSAAMPPAAYSPALTADVGHFASCGYDTVDAIRKLAPRLKLVHLKDVEASGGEVNVLLGKGISKIPEVMRELHRQNFAHLIAIEYEKEGDVNRDMKADVEFARKFA